MKVIKTRFSGLMIIQPRIHKDQRGYFFESYNKKALLEKDIDINFVQDNQSMSNYGVIRGMHYQLAPYAQTKLVRVLYGKVVDVVVDLRQGSLTFGHNFKIELSDENQKQLLIPPGFAHGFAALSQKALLHYKCDKYYMPDYERGINPGDPYLNIDWGLGEGDYIISEKDWNLPRFEEAEMNYYI